MDRKKKRKETPGPQVGASRLRRDGLDLRIVALSRSTSHPSLGLPRTLHVDATVGVGTGAAVTAGAAAAAPAVAVAVIVGLTVVGLPVAVADAVSVHPGENASKEEHDGVHDAESKAGFEHGTGLVHTHVDANVKRGVAERAQRHRDGIARPHLRAVCLRHHAHRVDRADEGADE